MSGLRMFFEGPWFGGGERGGGGWGTLRGWAGGGRWVGIRGVQRRELGLMCGVLASGSRKSELGGLVRRVERVERVHTSSASVLARRMSGVGYILFIATCFLSDRLHLLR